jgi:hypothetical protein
MKKTILTILVSAMMPVMAVAQALPFVAADYDPSTLSKGGAGLTQTSSIAYSAFGNAAAVPFSDINGDFVAGYTLWTPGGIASNVINVAGAYNIKQKIGVTAGFSYGMNPAYDVYDQSGVKKGQFKPSDMHVKVGVAYRFLPFLSLGANVGYASSALAEGSSYGSLDADVFLMARFAGFKVAAGVSDLGTGITSAAGTKYPLPTAGALGLGYETTFAEEHSIDAQVDAEYYFSGAFGASLGAAYTYHDLVSVRAGYRYGGQSVLPSFISVGAGVKFKGAKIDVAYLIGNSPIANTLAVSLGYCF